MFGDESLELKLEDVKMTDLGEAGEVVMTKDDTLLMKGEWYSASAEVSIVMAVCHQGRGRRRMSNDGWIN